MSGNSHTAASTSGTVDHSAVTRTDGGSTAVLEVDSVTKKFSGLVAVDDISLSVPDGTITGLIGPNGAGKSTLFNCISGITPADTGTIRLSGEEIQDRSPHEIAARGIGRTFQTPRIFRGMSVRENLAFAVRQQAGERVYNPIFRPGTVSAEEEEIQTEVEEKLEFLDLDHLADEYALNLSGGQRKLLELGRVLMLDPEVIMLDEPAAGVNPALMDELLDRLHELNERGRTIFFIEHNMDIIMNHSDHVLVMHNGRLLASGPPEEVQNDDRVLDAYLGGV